MAANERHALGVRVAAFGRALARLEEALAREQDDLSRDGCIQRFELTFDTAWKALQSRARIEGIDCASPRQCLRAAFCLGLIDADPRWMQMAEDRNRTSQTYDEGTAREVFSALPGYLEVLKPLLQSLLSDLPT